MRNPPKNIGIIGFGNMGSSIAERLKTNYQIVVFDKDKDKTKNLEGIEAADNTIDLLKQIETVILAVKPQDFDSVLNEIKDYTKGKLIISIAAGITTDYVEKILGIARVIRGMPNLPARIGEGITCISKGKFTTEEDFDFAENLFAYLGKTLRTQEAMMNAATAISGSGPAYVCNYLESKKEKEKFLNDFQSAAETIGFNTEQAALLVNTTFSGTIEFLRKTKLAPSELKKQVASKGGATEVALEILEAGGTLEEAIKAAKERAGELSKQ